MWSHKLKCCLEGCKLTVSKQQAETFSLSVCVCYSLRGLSWKWDLLLYCQPPLCCQTSYTFIKTERITYLTIAFKVCCLFWSLNCKPRFVIQKCCLPLITLCNIFKHPCYVILSNTPFIKSCLEASSYTKIGSKHACCPVQSNAVYL